MTRTPKTTAVAEVFEDISVVGYVRPELGDLVVPISQVTPYPGNARIGNQELIAQSLDSHGQYKPLLVQRSTGYVLVGNNTLATMHELGWTHVAVQFLDVDDDRARNMLLFDNRTSDLAGYDNGALAELLAEVDDWDATGWELADLDSLLAELGTPDNLGTPDEQPAPRPARGMDLSDDTLPGGDPLDQLDTGDQEPDAPGDEDTGPAQREFTVTLDDTDHVELAQLIAVGKAWLGRDRTTGQIIMSALRVLAVIGDARDHPTVTIDIRAMLKAADYDDPGE